MAGAVPIITRTTDGRRVIPFSAGEEFFFINVASVGNPANDLVVFRGSATRKVIFLGFKIVLNILEDAATLAYMFLMRRTGIGTGGVATENFTAVNLDQSTEAATASAFGWFTSPSTRGVLVGVVDMQPTAGVGGVAPQDPHAALSTLAAPFAHPGSFGGIALDGVNDTVTVGFQDPGRAVFAGGVAVWAAAHWVEILPREDD